MIHYLHDKEFLRLDISYLDEILDILDYKLNVKRYTTDPNGYPVFEDRKEVYKSIACLKVKLERQLKLLEK